MSRHQGPIRMPFGKHKGVPVGEIPTDYLAWALTVAKPWLRPHIEAELARQGYDTDDKPPMLRRLTLSNPELELAEKIVHRGFRALSPDFHPDRNGDHESFIDLQRVKDAVLQLLHRR